MKEKIDNPFIISKSYASIILSNYAGHKDWNKNCFDDLKKEIKAHYRSEQENLCVYCKRELGFDVKTVEIEHFFPKKKFPQFGFEPLNLSLSCPGCNLMKGIIEVSKHEYKRYPSVSTKMLIVHPHYDEYSEHIFIHKEMIYRGITRKGDQTIATCRLNRLYSVEKNVKQHLKNKSTTHRIIEELRNSDQKDIAEIKDLLGLNS